MQILELGGGSAQMMLLLLLAIMAFVVFFAGYGQWFIPVLLVLLMAGAMYYMGLHRRMQPWQAMGTLFLAFFMGWLLQRLSIVAVKLSTVPTLADYGIALVYTLIIALLFYLITSIFTVRKLRWLR